MDEFNGMTEEEWVEFKTAELVANGFFELSLDEDGEFSFRLSEDAEDIDPLAYSVIAEAHYQNTMEEVQELVDLGFVEVCGINEDGEALYGLTEAGKAYTENLSL